MPGIISLFTYGLNLAIDFTGGSVFEYSFSRTPNISEIKDIFSNNGVVVENVVSADNNKWIRCNVVILFCCTNKEVEIFLI